MCYSATRLLHTINSQFVEQWRKRTAFGVLMYHVSYSTTTRESSLLRIYGFVPAWSPHESAIFLNLYASFSELQFLLPENQFIQNYMSHHLKLSTARFRGCAGVARYSDQLVITIPTLCWSSSLALYSTVIDSIPYSPPTCFAYPHKIKEE